MKNFEKKLLLITLLLVPIMMSGCEKKDTITCSKSGKSIYVFSNTTMLVTLNGKEKKKAISEVSKKDDVTVQKKYKKYLNIMKSSLKNVYSEYQGKSVTKSFKSKDLLITTSITFDTSKMSKSDVYEIEGLKITKDEKVTEDGIIKTLKDNGYKCKGGKK